MSLTISFPKPIEELKGWGKELVLINCSDYCSKFLDFKAGGTSSLHFHSLKHESWFILSGEIKFIWTDTDKGSDYSKILKTGDMVDIPKNCPHQVIALIDTRILEVSTKHFDDDSYRVRPGDSQNYIAQA